ncbi:hypothetical protein GBAR_LOCUS2172 [Geodia barretti]|uniref:Uncharacterized protein n=1 Tax=Geodia barretti TaxID=519541 RepID=A0AA35QZQ3_GEOBA|nr:hypothetical protein GBAR_LOCUS2172 [Geodia barretti]
MNQTFGVTVIVVTHYPGVAHHTNRVVHIRDGRISSESFMQTTFRRADDLVQQEYLVVDRVGRLQLPPDYVEQMRRNGLAGLASADFADGQVTIRPAGRPDAGPTPVQAQLETEPQVDLLGDIKAESPPEIMQEQTQVQEQGLAKEPLQDPLQEPIQETVQEPAQERAQEPEPDPHALFRRPSREGADD